MSKKVWNLTYNELIKQFKKKSLPIMLTGVLALSVGAPIAAQYINQQGQSGNAIIHGGLNEDEMSQITNAGNLKDQVMVKGTEIYKNINSQIDNQKIDFESWKYKALQDKLNIEINILALEEAIKGGNIETIKEAIEFLRFGNIDSTLHGTQVEMQNKLTNLKKENVDLEKIIADNNYLGYMEIEKGNLENKVTEFKKDIAKKEKDIAKLKVERQIKAEKISIENLKIEVANFEQDLRIINYRIKNKINPDTKNWQNETIKNIMNNNMTVNMGIMPEADFNGGGEMSYSQYKIEAEGRINLAKEALIADWYSLDNNIPQMKFVKDARHSLLSTYEVVTILAVLVVILVGSGIVSSEFSSGSIRLLMIRPVSRRKILVSKLFALSIIGFGTLALGITACAITSGILGGFGSFAIPVISVAGGSVVVSSFISVLLKSILFSAVSVGFMIALVFTLSTLIRNMAMTAVVGLLTFLGSAGLVFGLGSMGINLGSTFLASISTSIFNLLPNLVEMLKTQGVIINQTIGVPQLIIIAVALLVTAFVVFKKKDIKN